MFMVFVGVVFMICLWFLWDFLCFVYGLGGVYDLFMVWGRL